ncbi:hypothetical protein Glove_248g17 [Diversispora epigaea]|uniref:BED-type domain-containing protein n=1 Tax=Diversispora epigaea TaxID=1348612 RepID=A0A397IG13_9GLOM|nr:hypothetical protein Glove_248g17 [Diversispora epigaea]
MNKIEIESNNSHAKSKVWKYFTKPYDPPKSRKTKCHECGNEFSYHDSPSSLKYHFQVQVKRQQQSFFSSYSEPSFLSVDENSLLQSNTISLVMSNNSDILTAEEGFFTVLDKLLKINRNDKGNNDALIIRGKFYQKMGEYEESIEDYNRALEIEPNNVNALISRGDAYIEIGKYELNQIMWKRRFL